MESCDKDRRCSLRVRWRDGPMGCADCEEDIGDVVVVGTALSPRSFAPLKEVDIDEIVDYKSQKISDVVSDVDLVLDSVWRLSRGKFEDAQAWWNLPQHRGRQSRKIRHLG